MASRCPTCGMTDPMLRMGVRELAQGPRNVTVSGFASDSDPVSLFFALLLAFFVILCAVAVVNSMGRREGNEGRQIELEDDGL